MNTPRFAELVKGPLCSTVAEIRNVRLLLALKAVVEATGAAGEKALEDHCATLLQRRKSEEL